MDRPALAKLEYATRYISVLKSSPGPGREALHHHGDEESVRGHRLVELVWAS